MLATQFEVADGRRFAPMWDEPSAKATFALEVVIPAGESAYSNMPVASTKAEGDKQRVRFETSPRMSSYLLFLAVGELERISQTVAGVDVGVVTRKGAGSSGRYALEAAVETLPWFNDYFGTPYPLPKLDMIAVPGSSQFFAAMENWGAIMYFEPALLVDPRLSSQSDRQAVFVAVAHEVAHQWFGDLVTMDWWDDLWLNEGYATWMELKVESALHPERKPALEVMNDSREQALRRDAGAATHPVVQTVDSVDAASQAFDAIAYHKGGAVIRMLEDTLGEAGFRAGIRRYMKRYAYGNAATDQLWAELAAATGKPVTDIAHDFTLQPGVPLVSVEAAPCTDARTSLTLSQGRFETGPKSAAAHHVAYSRASAVDLDWRHEGAASRQGRRARDHHYRRLRAGNRQRGAGRLLPHALCTDLTSPHSPVSSQPCLKSTGSVSCMTPGRWARRASCPSPATWSWRKLYRSTAIR